MVSLVSANDLVNFNRQANRYELELIEREVPTAEEISERRTERLLGRLEEDALESTGELTPLVDALWEHPKGKLIVATLLKKRLAETSKVEVVDEDESEAPKQSEQSSRPPRRRRRGRRTRQES